MAQPGLPASNQALRAMSVLLALVLGWLGSSPAAQRQAPEVAVDLWDQKLVRRSVLITPNEFSPARAEQISREFLEARRSKFRALKLSVFVDADDERRTDSGKGQTDVTYAYWRRLYELHGRQALPMARTLAVGQDAVLQWRDQAGRIGRKVLSGNDPLLVRQSGHLFEILDIGMWKLPYSDRVYKNSMRASAIVRTRPTSAEQLRAFFDYLASRLDLADFSVYFRSDHWFITNDSFPIVYRFDQVLDPPTERDYIGRFRGHCYMRSGEANCEVGGPY